MEETGTGLIELLEVLPLSEAFEAVLNGREPSVLIDDSDRINPDWVKVSLRPLAKVPPPNLKKVWRVLEGERTLAYTSEPHTWAQERVRRLSDDFQDLNQGIDRLRKDIDEEYGDGQGVDRDRYDHLQREMTDMLNRQEEIMKAMDAELQH